MLNSYPELGFTPLMTNMSIKITSDVPLMFYVPIFLKNKSLLNRILNKFKGFSSICIMIMTINNSYLDILRANKTIFVKNSNWSIDLKIHPGMVPSVRIRL